MKILPALILGLALLLPGRLLATEARVTQIIRDVKLLPSAADARPAVVNDKVAEDTGVRTGGDSRSELTFPDLTITRLGSNTVFSFSKAGRTAKVDSGSILLRVPKDSGGGTVKTNAVTVAVTGTTLIFESGRGGKSKLITLEGSARMALVKKPRDFRYVRAGQMLDVPAGATTLPNPVNIDINQLMKTHPLITDFPPLPSRDLIYASAPPPEPPSSSGPNIRISPIISIIGGLTGPTGPRGPRRPPSKPPTRPSDNNTTDGVTQNQQTQTGPKPTQASTPKYQKPQTRPKATPKPTPNVIR